MLPQIFQILDQIFSVIGYLFLGTIALGIGLNFWKSQLEKRNSQNLKNESIKQ